MGTFADQPREQRQAMLKELVDMLVRYGYTSDSIHRNSVEFTQVFSLLDWECPL